MKSKQRDRARFGVFELDLTAGELHKNGEVVLLQEQPFQVLRMLVECGGDVVTREEIKKRLWPNDTVVEFDHGINTAIKKLRQILGDSADNPHYIQTVARRGYRLVVPVEWLESADSSSGDSGVLGVKVAGQQAKRPSLTGTRVSHYRVLEVVGGGGMGVVYKAEDLKLGRRVALKFLPEEVVDEPLALQRFEREARAASALEHPNICPIYEFGEHEGQPFLAMQLLEGQTLRERLATSRLSNDELLRVAVSLCDGMDAAHRKGIIHRDIKPANIFITDQGEVKILDFGLAKLSQLVDLIDPMGRGNSKDARSDRPVSLTLTRTGVALGTAHYMSPEQVRGEKLDARTDLFSFGLVLYEMATGQQAFSGNTVAIVHDAILNQAQVRAKELDSAISPALDEIIDKALQKNREQRYQSAAEMRAELLSLQERSAPGLWGKRRLTFAIAALLILVLVVGGGLWLLRRQRLAELQPAGAPQIRQRQLTTNTADNPVADAWISRDGRQLAYYDRKGIHVKVLATGEIKTLSTPDALKGKNIEWAPGPWLHDGTTLIATAIGEGTSSTWAFSLTEGASRKLRDDAATYDLSPDGSQIVFTRNQTKLGAHEMWLMDVNGNHARQISVAGENSGYGDNVGWAPNGRIAYVRIHETPWQREHILESLDPRGGPPVRIFSTPSWWQNGGLMGWEWLPGGRLLYELTGGSTINGYSCNYWDMWVDEHAGKPRSAPRQVTNWAGFCMQSMTATADYKQISFLRVFFSLNVLVAALDATGAHATNPQRLTASEDIEYPTAWTADSKSIIFHSNRNGSMGIFRQALGEENPQSIVMGTEDSIPASSTVSPDGMSLIYTLVPNDQGGTFSSKQIMSVPITGGTSRLLLNAQLTGSPRCARAPATLCMIAERSADRKQLAFTALDPMKGRATILARFDTDTDGVYSWDISPDGRQIAVAKQSTSRFDILSLDGRATRSLTLKGWSIGVDRPPPGRDPVRGADFDWAANGKGFYVASGPFRTPVLLFVDLQGNARIVREQKGGEAPGGRGGFSGLWGIPSPDGKHLAILNWNRNRNVWLMENF